MKLVTALAVSVLAACSSVNPYTAKRETLRHADERIGKSELAPAATELDGLLVETDEQASTFALQRFYAAYLLAQIHMRAAVGQPFAGSASSARSNGDGPRVSHLVAATWYSGLAQAWGPQARGSKTDHKGQAILPDPLAATSVDTALRNLGMCELVVQRQLSFEVAVKRTLERNKSMLDDKNCDEQMKNVGLHASLQPWVRYAVFSYLRDRNEPMAYRFGVRALEGRDVLGEQPTGEIKTWIRSGSHYAFRCPKCKHLADPDERVCSEDPDVPVIEFFPEQKSATGR